MTPSIARRYAQLSPADRRRLLLVLAAAEERLMRVHTAAAATFVRTVADELSFERALSIYLRLLDVPPAERRAVTVGALARLSRTLPAEALAAGGGGAGPFQRLGRRLRGRRRPALRTRIDPAAVRARKAVRSAHLAGARAVVALLRGALEPSEAVQLYLDTLALGPGWAARIFHDALARVPGEADEGEDAHRHP